MWVLSGIVVILLTAMVLLNAVDDEPTPEVVALIERARTEQIAQEDNAYFAVRGLHAPIGQDIVAFGRALHAADQREVRGRYGNGTYVTGQPPASIGPLRFTGESMNLCTVWNVSLYNNGVCRFQAETDRMLQDNSELLRRYYSLLSFRTYEEPATTLLPLEPDLIGLMRLANVDMERKLERGKRSEAATLIARNLAFWRRALDGKFGRVAEAQIRVNYSYSLFALSELLWRTPELLDEADLPNAIGKPIARNPERLRHQRDRAFMDVYLAEEGSLLYADNPDRGRNPAFRWLDNRLFMRNATLNAYLTCLDEYYSARMLSGAELQAKVATRRERELDSVWGEFVNVTGRRLLRWICPNQNSHWMLDFESRIEARRRLLLLEIKLLGSKRPASSYPDLLRATGSDLNDPETGKPARWAAGRRMLYFEDEQGCIADDSWVNLGPTTKFVRCPSRGESVEGEAR
jgi:hypothetical protein